MLTKEASEDAICRGIPCECPMIDVARFIRFCRFNGKDMGFLMGLMGLLLTPIKSIQSNKVYSTHSPHETYLPLSSIPFHPLLAGAVHLFLDAALLLEVVLLPFNQSADEDIALVDEGDGYVGNGFGRALLDFFAIDGRVEVGLAKGACLHASGSSNGHCSRPRTRRKSS